MVFAIVSVVVTASAAVAVTIVVMISVVARQTVWMNSIQFVPLAKLFLQQARKGKKTIAHDQNLPVLLHENSLPEAIS